VLPITEESGLYTELSDFQNHHVGDWQSDSCALSSPSTAKTETKTKTKQNKNNITLTVTLDCLLMNVDQYVRNLRAKKKEKAKRFTKAYLYLCMKNLQII
jgi:hypothetical protein